MLNSMKIELVMPQHKEQLGEFSGLFLVRPWKDEEAALKGSRAFF